MPRFSTGGGAHNRLRPEEPEDRRAAARRRLLWFAGAFALGLAYPYMAPFGPLIVAPSLGLPLLVVAWATRPLSPGDRLLGFVAFALSAASIGFLG